MKSPRLFRASSPRPDKSVLDIKEVSDTINNIAGIAAQIAQSVEEQGMATDEIARAVDLSAQGASDVATNIAGVSKGASETGAASAEVLGAAESLAKESSHWKAKWPGSWNSSGRGEARN